MTSLSQHGVADPLSGNILVNTKPLGPVFQKFTGLLLQADVHLKTQIVWEGIRFSALLRKPREVPREEELERRNGLSNFSGSSIWLTLSSAPQMPD